MLSFIDLTAADGFKFPIYCAQPQGHARGAVVVMQKTFGLHSHSRSVVDGYAAQGYLALAPSTFHRVKPGVDLGYTADGIAVGVALKALVDGLPAPGVLQDVQAVINHAAMEAAGKVGLAGYCRGGLLAWPAACLLNHVSAVVSYCGGGITTPAEVARTPTCPVLAHFAQHDQSISIAGVEVFRQAHPEVEMHLYDASHGFNCDHRAAYNATAAALAQERTLAFFERTLRG